MWSLAGARGCNPRPLIAIDIDKTIWFGEKWGDFEYAKSYDELGFSDDYAIKSLRLLSKKYALAYVTGRKRFPPNFFKFYPKGIPFLKPSRMYYTPDWKRIAFKRLQQKYDVRYFFDDRDDNLAVAREMGIKGIKIKKKEDWKKIYDWAWEETLLSNYNRANPFA